MKIQIIAKTIWISIILLLVMLFQYHFMYMVCLNFHEPWEGSFDDVIGWYELCKELRMILIGVTLPFVVMFTFYFSPIKGILIHVFWFLVILFIFSNQFNIRPYTFSLEVISIASSILLRPILIRSYKWNIS